MATRKTAKPKPNRPPKKRSEVRSGFEFKVLKVLEQSGVSFEYETEVLSYTVPTSTHKYTPDFLIRTASGNTVYLEVKGILDRETRKKMLLVIKQHPDKDIRFLFQRDNSLSKKSKTKYSEWARKNGIEAAVSATGTVPLDWLNE